MKMRSLKIGSLAAALCLAVLISPAAAQRADEMKGGGQHPCAGDAQRLCGEFMPDRGKIASCLSQKKRELSPACAQVMGGGKTKVGKSRKGKRHGRRHRRR